MRVVFLDFDGVLNSHEYMARVGSSGEPVDVAGLDPFAVVRLNRLVREGEAVVVVSSSWRHGRTLLQLGDILRAAGFKGALQGKTPDYAVKRDGTIWEGAMRGNEVQAWLDGAPLYGLQVDSFVILDDDSDMAHLADRHVKTSMFDGGLRGAHVDKALRLLATPMPTIVEPTAELVARFVP